MRAGRRGSERHTLRGKGQYPNRSCRWRPRYGAYTGAGPVTQHPQDASGWRMRGFGNVPWGVTSWHGRVLRSRTGCRRQWSCYLSSLRIPPGVCPKFGVRLGWTRDAVPASRDRKQKRRIRPTLETARAASRSNKFRASLSSRMVSFLSFDSKPIPFNRSSHVVRRLSHGGRTQDRDF